MGADAEPISISLIDLISKRIRIIGSQQNGPEYLYEALDFVAQGKVKTIVETYPLAEAPKAYDRVAQGKALHAGISSYSSARTLEAAEVLRELGVPLLIHQPSYSMLNRWIEEDRLLDTLEAVGAGCIAFSPLAQGLLTDRYLDGIPDDSRGALAGYGWLAKRLSDERALGKVEALRPIADELDCSLAQLALAWCAKNPNVSTVITGASRPSQVTENFEARHVIAQLDEDVLARIDAAVK